MKESNMAELDCLACGACCTHAGEVIVAPDENVPRHLTRSVRHMMGFASWEAEDGVRIMTRRDCGTCSALSLRKGQNVCRIYDRRPAVCRAFAPGTAECTEARTLAHVSL